MNSIDGVRNESMGSESNGNGVRVEWHMAHSGQASLAKQETYAYASDSNRLLRVDSEQGIKQESRSLGYDSVGNIIQDSRQGDARRLRYGAANRLLDVSAANDEQISKVPGSDYRYNAKGQRVIKIVDGRAIHFHYDAFDRLISETNSQGLPLREYIYGAGQRLALVDYEHSDIPKLGAIRYVLNDHLGTPQLLLDAKQSIVWSAQGTRTPFGENLLASNDSNIKQPLQFPGQYADETGYSYNYFRDYDPSLGRYIQSDPIGLGGGVNTFGYVGGNPVVNGDPTGTVCGTGLCIGTIAVVGGKFIIGGGATYAAAKVKGSPNAASQAFVAGFFSAVFAPGVSQGFNAIKLSGPILNTATTSMFGNSASQLLLKDDFSFMEVGEAGVLSVFPAAITRGASAIGAPVLEAELLGAMAATGQDVFAEGAKRSLSGSNNPKMCPIGG